MTERRYREAEMSPAVCEWIRSMGYTPYAEVPVYGGTCDHAGVRWSDLSVIFVEMKCTLSDKVIYQAILKQTISPLVYVAVPCKPRKKSIDAAASRGLGVWAAGMVIVEPNYPHERDMGKWRENVLEFCRKSPEGGIGGMPTVKGDGPAIRCEVAVKAYLEQHPDSSWKQIFKEVPNHYAHARSMAGALGFVRSRLAREAVA
jgi:hypothetical protein